MDAAHLHKRYGVLQKVVSWHALHLQTIQELIQGSTQELVSNVLLAASEVHVLHQRTWSFSTWWSDHLTTSSSVVESDYNKCS